MQIKRSVTVLALLALLQAMPAGAQTVDADEFKPALVKPLAERSLLLDGASVDGLQVVVGERGHILRSLDGGSTWEQAEVPTQATLTGVFLHDEQRGWAVGHDAVVLHTTDGGASWQVQYAAPEEELPLLDVWFANARQGMAIGAYGYFLRTEDGGESWESVLIAAEPLIAEEGDDESAGYDEYDDFGGDYHLNQMAPAAGGRLYIAAEAGTVYRSDDGGRNWFSLPSPYDGSFFGTLPLDGDSLLLYGLRGHLYRSDDAGENWRSIDSGTEAALTDAVRLADGTVIVAGMAGTLLVSRDGGESFSMQPRPDRQALAKLLPVSEEQIVLLGEYGTQSLPVGEIEVGP